MAVAKNAGLFTELDDRDFRAGSFERRVFRVGAGPPVLLLHELPGLSPLTLAFARERLAPAGFSVHMPVLFGEPGDRKLLCNTARVCLSQVIALWRSGCESPLLDWLKALCQDLRSRHPGPGVGVIGMCITGHFAIALMAEPSVVAPVTCQPVVPLWPCAARQLGLSSEQLRSVEMRAAASAPKPALLGLRFEADCLSPQARFEHLRASLGAGFEAHEIPGRGHSTLIEHFDPDTNSPTSKALVRVLAFLRERLLVDHPE